MPRWPDTLRPPPLVAAWLCVSAGTLVGLEWFSASSAWIGPLLALFAMVAALVIPSRWRSARAAALAIAAVSVSASLASHRLHAGPEPLEGSDTPRLLRTTGVVEPGVRIDANRSGAFARFARYRQASTRFTLRLTDRPGRLIVRVDSTDVEVRAGDHIAITAMASPLRPPANPGEFDARRWAALHSVIGAASMPDPALIDHLPPPDTVPAKLDAWRFGVFGLLRERAHAALESTGMGDRADALAGALLLGLRDDALEPTRQALVDHGAAHLLAISGLHLGVLAALAIGVIRLAGDHPRLELLAAAIVAILVLALVPARTPIVRSGVMILAFVAAEAIGRRYDRLNLLAGIAVVILLVRPGEILNPGYQLSFAAVAALMTLTRPLREQLFTMPPDIDARTTRQHLVERTRDVIAAGVVLWLVTTPIAAFHFGHVAWFASFASLVLLVPVALVLGFGYAGMVVGVVWPALATPFLWAAALSTRATLWLIETAEPVRSLTLRIGPIDALWPIAAVLAAVLMIRLDPRRWIKACVLVAAVAWFAASVWLHQMHPPDRALTMRTFAVGDGTCHLVRTDTGNVFFDCGSSDLGAGEQRLYDSLRAFGVGRVRTAVLSHPDLDHYSALVDLAKRVGLRRVIVGERLVEQARVRPDGPAAELVERLDRMGVAVEVFAAGDTIELATGVRAEVLWPPSDPDRTLSDNNAALVWLITAETESRPRRILLTADAEDIALAGVMDRLRALAGGESQSAPLRPDVLELPHHGSAREAAMAFVRSLDPPTVVQSTGPRRLADRRWDHLKPGRVWLMTARDGAITTVITRGGRVEARPSRQPHQQRGGEPESTP